MNVAQLKLTCERHIRQRQTPFPRLNERGSIEAQVPGNDRSTRSAFPRLNERGSIEAFDRSFMIDAPDTALFLELLVDHRIDRDALFVGW